MREKLKKIIKNIFPKNEDAAKEVSSTLLNFIVKTKREKSFKEKIKISPPEGFKKINNLKKKFYLE